jgi:hypothetical protein
MPFGKDPPLHDFPDRAHRMLLEWPPHLSELVHQAHPALADGFLFEKTEVLRREYLMPDWRRRECDLLFQIPYREAGNEETALVCVLVEQQSKEDSAMPLRTLLYATAFWEQQWREREQAKSGKPLRLSPVFPIVFHTGAELWETNRALLDLMPNIPAKFRPFVPTWQPLFWNLAEKTPQELLNVGGEWLSAMAVVRADQMERSTYETTLGQTLKRLESLYARDKMRWQDLMWFITSWTVKRRPPPERRPLFDAAIASMDNVALQHEVRMMSQQIELTWDEWAKTHYTAEGEKKGELRGARRDLRAVLEERFGALPEALVQGIEATEDLQRLQACIRQSVRIQSLAELQL